MRIIPRSVSLPTILLLLVGFGIEGLFAPAEAQSPASPAPSLRMPADPEHQITTSSSRRLIVNYRDGRLAIDAQDATLAEVLRLVGARTGARIDVPPGAGLEHIFEHSGPGPITNVLEHLLNGSSFNFVIINSPQSSSPQQISLTLQGASPAAVIPAPMQTSAPSFMWTPPDTTDRPIPLSAESDDTLVAPSQAMSAEQMSEFMRQKQREVREKALQRYPQ